jgi:plasmid stabilization system protein ParE
MELTVYWTRFAEDKLEDIFSYYESEASSKIAHKLIRGIIDRTIRLSTNPFIGQKEELLADRPQDFRYLVYKNYKIIYWIDITREIQ